ncbi:MAG: vitamin B12 dependent-methionine synthase activation domain-containing protein [Desulfitobacteriaceae bacterium]|nr:vitamin B12 dependent-methionine synthase activation domain-containing protein [Desulfitobacteriaceae bacterium]
MSTVILDRIPFEIDMALLSKNLHIKEGSDPAARVERLVESAKAVARPKAVYKVAYVESKDDDSVVVDGTKFTSRVLRVNLEDTYRVFPYVVTSGTEIEEWSQSITDIFDNYCADAIKEMIMRSARHHVFAEIDEKYGLAHAAVMNPGSLADWPIKEQKNLFALLGDTKESIGVQLTDSFLMLPIKTVSGMRFPKKGTYENCQLCPRKDCPGRKAPYDKDLYNEKYKMK